VSIEWSLSAPDARDAQGARAAFLLFIKSNAATGDFAAAELIFGELIGNVVRHSAGPIAIRVKWQSNRPTLSVSDCGARFEANSSLPADPFSEYGRGFFLIRSLSDDLRIEHILGVGNTVSVSLPIWSAERDPQCQSPRAYSAETPRHNRSIAASDRASQAHRPAWPSESPTAA